METNKNIMPELHLFPKLEKVGRFLGSLVAFHHTEPQPYHSNHYHGAEAMLVAHLDNEQLQLDLMTADISGAGIHSELYELWERGHNGSVA